MAEPKHPELVLNLPQPLLHGVPHLALPVLGATATGPHGRLRAWSCYDCSRRCHFLSPCQEDAGTGWVDLNIMGCFAACAANKLRGALARSTLARGAAPTVELSSPSAQAQAPALGLASVCSPFTHTPESRGDCCPPSPFSWGGPSLPVPMPPWGGSFHCLLLCQVTGAGLQEPAPPFPSASPAACPLTGPGGGTAPGALSPPMLQLCRGLQRLTVPAPKPEHHSPIRAATLHKNQYFLN